MQNKEICKERLIAIINKKEKELNDLTEGLKSSKQKATSLGLSMNSEETEKNITKLSNEINLLRSRLAATA